MISWYNIIMENKYYKHKIENLINIQKLVTIHYFDFHKNFKAPEEHHDFWEMVYADKNDIICEANGKEILLKEGEAIFHKPLEPHSLRADGTHSPNVFIISFVCKSQAIGFFEEKKIKISSEHTKYIYSIISESKKTFDLPYSDPKLKKMKLLPYPTLGGQQLIKNLLEILLINLMRCESESSNSSHNIFFFRNETNEKIAGAVIEYMKENIRKKITVDELCSSLHYNRSYTFREFKRATGKTVMSYFLILKVDKAKKILCETSLPISKIADELGFENPGYFSKTFKKATGYTPSKYRQIRKAQ